jgi:hypothetical protein
MPQLPIKPSFCISNPDCPTETLQEPITYYLLPIKPTLSMSVYDIPESQVTYHNNRHNYTQLYTIIHKYTPYTHIYSYDAY